jgi:hypothetical protein
MRSLAHLRSRAGCSNPFSPGKFLVLQRYGILRVYSADICPVTAHYPVSAEEVTKLLKRRRLPHVSYRRT